MDSKTDTRHLEAAHIARTCHGLANTGGVREMTGPSGLARLINIYLSKHVGHGAIVIEEKMTSRYFEGRSTYYPSWK